MLTLSAATPFNAAQPADQQSLSRNLLRAAQMDRLPLTSEDKAFAMYELCAPLGVDTVAEAARTPEEAAEMYAVWLLVIEQDQPAERTYLNRLASLLKIEPELVANLHATVEGATKPVEQPS